MNIRTDGGLLVVLGRNVEISDNVFDSFLELLKEWRVKWGDKMSRSWGEGKLQIKKVKIVKTGWFSDYGCESCRKMLIVAYVNWHYVTVKGIRKGRFAAVGWCPHCNIFHESIWTLGQEYEGRVALKKISN